MDLKNQTAASIYGFPCVCLSPVNQIPSTESNQGSFNKPAIPSMGQAQSESQLPWGCSHCVLLPYFPLLSSHLRVLPCLVCS